MTAIAVRSTVLIPGPRAAGVAVERVTVIEAGPCYVTAIRRAERDGYDAIQLAFGETTEKQLTKTKLGLLKKAGVGNLRHLREFRGEPGELEVGAEVKVDSVF